MSTTSRLARLLIISALFVSACGSDGSTDESTAESSASDNGAVTTVDPDAFFDGALTEDAVTTDCTLASGTQTSCYELTIAGFPATRDEIGPWCPKTTSDTAEDAGIWFDGDAVYDVDGEFITSLAEIYDDPTWKLYDDEGNVLSTDSSAKFNDLVTGGAQDEPDAGPVNLCVYGEIEWTENGGAVPSTIEIPITPIVADEPSDVGATVGVTLDGVTIDGSAPIELILGNYTIGVFDDCGGHVNPQEGYHMHATTGCSNAEQDVDEGETALFGYALDGYGIHAPYESDAQAGTGLDVCNGHDTDGLGYHYHANTAAENAVLTCFRGETTETANTGPGAGGPPPGGGAPPSDGQ